MGAFRYKGNVYPYFNGTYNGTRLNERAVEVPIALSYLNQSLRALEVGAVLPHYIPLWPMCAHECIDLNEQFNCVVNADVLTYQPNGKFGLVVSISTLDHLNSANEVRMAVERMKSWLVPGGLLFITLPANQPAEIGGGPWLDEMVLSGELGMSVTRMDKVNAIHHLWEERPLLTSPSLAYGTPTANANTVYLLEYVNE